MIHVPEPELQIDFAAALAEIRRQYLQDALSEAVARLSVPDIDKELAAHVPPHSLTMLATHGLRGEMMFPAPMVLAANPRLLAYTGSSTDTAGRNSITRQQASGDLR